MGEEEKETARGRQKQRVSEGDSKRVRNTERVR